MTAKELKEIYNYVNQNIDEFHKSRIEKIKKMKLSGVLLRKNPFLFKAKNLSSPRDLIKTILEAYLSSSEEGPFGKFMEGLAIYISRNFANGKKSTAAGLDLEFEKDGIRYLVAIKSGANWGNSSQYKQLRTDFKTAVRVLKQGNARANIQPVLGFCYGKSATRETGLYRRIAGQNFWYFICGDKQIYKQIIEPIGYQAQEHNKTFDAEKENIIAQFTDEFTQKFCDNGVIQWEKLVEFNSGNYQERPELPKPRKKKRRK